MVAETELEAEWFAIEITKEFFSLGYTINTLVSEEYVPSTGVVESFENSSFSVKPCGDAIKSVKPFLKWAGGKGQLLGEIQKYYPRFGAQMKKYAEPFVGGGAVLFDVLSKFDVLQVYISDINVDLINTYIIIRDDVNTLLSELLKMQNSYLPLDASSRKEYYLNARERFNQLKIKDNERSVEKAALMIFLNRTCFNGLFRVNRRGDFNVPMGRYAKPQICDEVNLLAVSERLQGVEIVCGDYKQVASFIDEDTFVYIDPPYRPISKTSSFTAYSSNSFGDNEQIELAKFVKYIAQKGAKVLVSNSDPKNVDEDDDFFDELYSDFNIKRVRATRMINSKSDARGEIHELLISNF